MDFVLERVLSVPATPGVDWVSREIADYTYQTPSGDLATLLVRTDLFRYRDRYGLTQRVRLYAMTLRTGDWFDLEESTGMFNPACHTHESAREWGVDLMRLLSGPGPRTPIVDALGPVVVPTPRLRLAA